MIFEMDEKVEIGYPNLHHASLRGKRGVIIPLDEIAAYTYNKVRVDLGKEGCDEFEPRELTKLKG